jgi:hypothetical protein
MYSSSDHSVLALIPISTSSSQVSETNLPPVTYHLPTPQLRCGLHLQARFLPLPPLKKSAAAFSLSFSTQAACLLWSQPGWFTSAVPLPAAALPVGQARQSFPSPVGLPVTAFNHLISPQCIYPPPFPNDELASVFYASSHGSARVGHAGLLKPN